MSTRNHHWIDKRFMRYCFCLLGIAFFLFGCGREESGRTASEPMAGEPIFSFTQKMHAKRLEEPSLAIVAFDPEKSPEMEIVTYKPLKQLALSIPGKFRAYEGFGVNGTRLSVLLYEYQKDPEIEGNVRLKFEVVDGEELLDIPLVSWNQEDDLDLCYGDCWLMKLTRNALVANE